MAHNLTHVQPRPCFDVAVSMRAKASSCSTRDAEAACEIFFARTAPAGPLDEGVARALMSAITETRAVDSDCAIDPGAIPSGQLHLIVEGWAYRARTLRDGGRLITDILLPGDLCDCAGSALEIDYELRACGFARVAVLESDLLAEQELRSLQYRMEWLRADEARMLRSRLLSLGRRDARGRVAHLLSELHGRLSKVGLATRGGFNCPLTQEQLADVLGLTSVHTNRVLQGLRRDGLITFDRRHVVIPDLTALYTAAGFDEVEAYVAFRG